MKVNFWGGGTASTAHARVTIQWTGQASKRYRAERSVSAAGAGASRLEAFRKALELAEVGGANPEGPGRVVPNFILVLPFPQEVLAELQLEELRRDPSW